MIGLIAGENPSFASGNNNNNNNNKNEFDTCGLPLLVLGIGFLQYVLERGESAV